MKNVVDARGEFLCCGHTVTTAVESHFHNRRLAPCVLAQGGGAIETEAMAMKRVGGLRIIHIPVDQQKPKICAAPDSASTLFDMDIIKTPQPPKRFKSNSELMGCLRKTLSNQDAIARIFWSAFQAQGYRLDSHDTQLEAVRDRLWRIECVLKMRAQKT